MKRLAALVFLAFLFAVTAYAQESPLSKLGWQFSGDGVIGDKATIKIPEGYAFLGAADTKKFMELNENLANGREYLFAPKDLSWFAVFEFSPVGYVKDDEKIDADSVLNTVRKGTEKGNEERRKRGWGTLTIQGWRFQPQYDKNAKLLEWAFVALDDRTSAPIINYNTRLLGRTGVMQVVLVSSPETLDQSVGSLKKALGGYDFTRGEKYAEFRPGDHVAEFGLAALIAGGAAAVATKKGLWAILGGFLAATWKFLAAAAVGLLAWLGALFKKKKS